jgi:hypothetical protein
MREMRDLSLRNTDKMEETSYEEWLKGKVKTQKITEPEKKAARIKAKYIREYQEL